MMVLPISIHVTKANIMRGVINGTIDFKTDTYRSIAEKVEPGALPQSIKHHLEELVKMGTIDKKSGLYHFDQPKVSEEQNNVYREQGWDAAAKYEWHDCLGSGSNPHLSKERYLNSFIK